MFDLGIEKIAVLTLVALFVLGPERLPAAAAWAGRAIRQAKAYAATANQQVRSELGPEFDQLRQPLADLRAPLQELRALREPLQNPRAAIMRHLFAESGSPTAAGAPPAPSGPVDGSAGVTIHAALDHEAT